MMMNNGTSASASSINPNKSVCLFLLSHLFSFSAFLCLPVLGSLHLLLVFFFYYYYQKMDSISSLILLEPDKSFKKKKKLGELMGPEKILVSYVIF